MSKNKYSKSFQLALSAMATSLAVIFLYFGTFNTYVLISCYIMAEVALMLPLSKGFIWGNVLAYVGTLILTLILGAIAKVWLLIPFAMFLGLHPLLNFLQLKFKMQKWVALIIKAVWFDATLYIGYHVLFGGVIGNEGNVLYEYINTYIIPVILVFGSVLFAFYDYCIFRAQITVNRLVNKIKK